MLAAKIGAILLLITAVFIAGMKVNDQRRDSIDLQLYRLSEQQRQHNQAMIADISASTALAISAIRVEHQTINTALRREIIREPIYIDCAVPVDGSRLLNKARGVPDLND